MRRCKPSSDDAVSCRAASRPFASLLFLAISTLLAHAVGAASLAGQQERTFRPLRSLGSGSELTASISLGDVDGDGDLDAVVANGRHWPGQNRIYINDGRAAFTLARPLGDELAGSYAVPLADLDGDGDLDVAVGNDRTRNLVFLNDGSGRFEAGAAFGTPSSTRSLTLADLNGDGHTDILVVNRGRRNFIFHGDGAGAFGEGVPFGTGDDSTIDVAAADLDADGDLDLVLANRDGGANAVHWNDDGSFARRTGFGTGGDETRGVAVGDVDGDGLPDIVTANIGEPNAVYFNRSGGGDEGRGPGDAAGGASVAAFREVRFGCEDCATYGVAVGDLNGDGFPEIVTANSGAPNGVFGNVGVGR